MLWIAIICGFLFFIVGAMTIGPHEWSLFLDKKTRRALTTRMLERSYGIREDGYVLDKRDK